MPYLTTAPLPVVGRDRSLAERSGPLRRCVDLDVAATAPALREVTEVAADVLGWYGSVHRGAGHHSQVSSALLEESRQVIGEFVGAREGDVVVLCRGTTDALVLLQHCLPPEVTVLSFHSEHHANLLPWRRGRHVELDIPATPADALGAVEQALQIIKGPVLLAVTGASNVTGELWPVRALADLVHASGGRVVVDAAQLAPHRQVELASLGADWVAFSGHKLYAPYGAGVLVGRRDWLEQAEPYLPGGGAALSVVAEGHAWASAPARHEGGTPNLLGAATLAAACRILTDRRPQLQVRERVLTEQLRTGLSRLDGVRVLRLWPEVDAVGIVSFVVAGHSSDQVAAWLAQAHGIGLRAGKFCAHPLVDHLTGGQAALRASIGAATTEADLQALLDALTRLPRPLRQPTGPQRFARDTARRLLRLPRLA